MKKLYRLFQSVAILAMLFFSIPKLTAQPPSVKGFTQFAEVLPVDPFVFMYLTGTIELSIVILLVTGLVAEWKEIDGYLRYASPLAFSLLLCTMLAALLVEFFVRPEAEMMLVIIALILIAGSVTGIYYHRKFLNGIRPSTKL